MKNYKSSKLVFLCIEENLQKALKSPGPICFSFFLAILISNNQSKCNAWSPSKNLNMNSENFKIYFKNIEPILWIFNSGFQYQQIGPPMTEMLKFIKKPGAMVSEMWIEPNFQALNLNPPHSYFYLTSYHIIAS